MNGFILHNIKAYGYERLAEIEKDNKLMYVYFFECKEYSEDYTTKVRSLGDSLSGELIIDNIIKSNISNMDLLHVQEKKMSSYIKIVVKVVEIIDKFTMMVKTDLIKENIRASFDEEFNYSLNDIIYIEGSLELELEEYED